MQRVSTNLTLVYKIFIPVFWLVLFGLITLAAWLADFQYILGYQASTVRIVLTLFFITGAAFLYWSVIRLKRVEMDEHFIFVTNYFQSRRYPYHNVASIVENNYILFRSISIILKEKGHFGKRLTFVPSRKLYGQFVEEHPELFAHLLQREE